MCWQTACLTAGKWDSHTAVFWCRGTLEIGVTVFHCQREKREENTGDIVMYRKAGKDCGETEKNIKVNRETHLTTAAFI